MVVNVHSSYQNDAEEHTIFITEKKKNIIFTLLKYSRQVLFDPHPEAPERSRAHSPSRDFLYLSIVMIYEFYASTIVNPNKQCLIKDLNIAEVLYNG